MVSVSSVTPMNRKLTVRICAIVALSVVIGDLRMTCGIDLVWYEIHHERNKQEITRKLACHPTTHQPTTKVGGFHRTEGIVAIRHAGELWTAVPRAATHLL